MHPQMRIQPQTDLMTTNERLDILEDLPRSTIRRYRNGEVIYDSDTPATHLYLVIEGRVKVLRTSVDGRDVLIDVYKEEELFGESALLNLPSRRELAIAIEPVRLMAWTLTELHNIVQTRPQLGTALSQILVQRLIECQKRVESFAVDRVNQRLARTLIQLADKLGHQSEDRSVRISGMNHQLLSDYVVTTRATVTHWMNCFRCQGLVRYSSDSLVVYPEAIRRWLDSNCVESRQSNGHKIPKRIATNPQPLTAREREVVGLVAQGMKNREIAQRLYISEQTVKNHLQNIFDKLGASNRYQASWRFAHLGEDHTVPAVHSGVLARGTC
jgi:CRP-like cAMP-binding protein/DNA-binding CsgD family transcriptional regulator